MKRTLKYALSAVLTAAIVLPAVAQDNFPDVPDNHWAFEALQRLKKDGLPAGVTIPSFCGRMAFWLAIPTASSEAVDLHLATNSQLPFTRFTQTSRA